MSECVSALPMLTFIHARSRDVSLPNYCSHLIQQITVVLEYQYHFHFVVVKVLSHCFDNLLKVAGIALI